MADDDELEPALVAPRHTWSSGMALHIQVHQNLQIPLHPVQIGPHELNLGLPKVNRPLPHTAVPNPRDHTLHGLEDGIALGHGILHQSDGVFGHQGFAVWH